MGLNLPLICRMLARPMRLDHLAGKRSEIDAINGMVPVLGREMGIKTPYNDTLVALVAGARSQLCLAADRGFRQSLSFYRLKFHGYEFWCSLPINQHIQHGWSLRCTGGAKRGIQIITWPHILPPVRQARSRPRHNRPFHQDRSHRHDLAHRYQSGFAPRHSSDNHCQ